MNPIRFLFSQTLLYGLSSVAGRFLNYLLTPVLTAALSAQVNGKMATIYALIALCGVVFAFAMDTTYFRYVNEREEQDVFDLCGTFLVVLNVVGLSALLCSYSLVHTQAGGIPFRFFVYAGYIVCADVFCVLPLARLRHQGRALRVSVIKLSSIGVNVLLVLVCLVWLPKYAPSFAQQYRSSGLDAVLLANMVASTLTLCLVGRDWMQLRWTWRVSSLVPVLTYAYPLVIASLIGVANEAIDRIMLPWLLPVSEQEKFLQAGVYAVNYKLSMLITLFVQAFRMGCEPFFFRRAGHKGAATLYAMVMDFFVAVCLFAFLCVVLFLDFWKQFINAHVNPDFASGLRVVPILLFANIFLGIYYNLSVSYKLRNQTRVGMYLGACGLVVTLVGNFWAIPRYGYMGCAWVTFTCYATMMCLSYIWGKKRYPIPYAVGKIGFYFALALGIYFAIEMLSFATVAHRVTAGVVGLSVFVGTVCVMQQKHLHHLLR